MINELDLVALLIDCPAMDLRRGAVGTVVHIYEGRSVYEVKFTNANGDTVTVETLTADEIKAINLNWLTWHFGDSQNSGQLVSFTLMSSILTI